jgi:hypothetical protein
MAGRRRRVILLLTTGGALLAAVTPWSLHAAALTTAAARSSPVPAPLPAPGDVSTADRDRLLHENGVDEGFLLGLRDSGGTPAYVPPQPERRGGDTGSLMLATMAGALSAVGGAALLLVLLLRPRAAPACARVSVALAPSALRWPLRRRRPARLSRETFERLPPLLQLALLDRSDSPLEAADDAPPGEAVSPAP